MHEGSHEPMRSLELALLERRIVLVSGGIEVGRAGEVAATLMTLDALGDEPVELRLNADSDSLEAAFALMDTIDALGVAVNATVGSVAGTMAGVLAVCRHRRIGINGRIHLREPQTLIAGVATELATASSQFEIRVEQYARRLAEATGQPFEHVEADLRTGRYLDAATALRYGMVDEIVGPP